VRRQCLPFHHWSGTTGVPHQFLDPVAALAAVDDHCDGEQIFRQHFLRQGGKSMRSLTKSNGGVAGSEHRQQR
jgi:hypothetical protein